MSSAPLRPVAGLKHALRRYRAQQSRKPCRSYVTAIESQSQDVGFLHAGTVLTAKRFRPSQTTKQNRFEEGLRRIPVTPPPRSSVKACPDPIATVYESQLKALDPTGARTRLFSDDNVERVQPGDILLVRLKSGDPFSGVVLNIRKRNSPIDTAILLRNQLTRVSVEMWFKIYSPNVEGIELVKRKEKRARRAKLYYMRKPKHDMGSVEGIVREYMKTRLGGAKAKGGASSNKKGKRK